MIKRINLYFVPGILLTGSIDDSDAFEDDEKPLREQN